MTYPAVREGTAAPTLRVIAVDQQAYGRTADIDRPIRYESMADDSLYWMVTP